MEKLRRFIIWLAVNGLWYTAAALGTIAGIAMAWNLFAFITWVLFWCSAFMWCAIALGEATGKPVVLPEPAVPTWMDIIMDLILTAVVVAYGHWFYGALLVFHIFAYSYWRTRPKTATPVAP